MIFDEFHGFFKWNNQFALDFLGEEVCFTKTIFKGRLDFLRNKSTPVYKIEKKCIVVDS